MLRGLVVLGQRDGDFVAQGSDDGRDGEDGGVGRQDAKIGRGVKPCEQGRCGDGQALGQGGSAGEDGDAAGERSGVQPFG